MGFLLGGSCSPCCGGGGGADCSIVRFTVPASSQAVSVYDGGNLIPLEYTSNYALVSRDVAYEGTKVGTQTMLLYYPCFGKTYDIPKSGEGSGGSSVSYALDNSEAVFYVTTRRVQVPRPTSVSILSATFIPKPVLRIAEDYGPAATPFTLAEMTAEPWTPAPRWGLNGTDPVPTNGFVGFTDASNGNRRTPYEGLSSLHALIGQEFLFDDLFSGVGDSLSQYRLVISVGTSTLNPQFAFHNPACGVYGPVETWDRSANGTDTNYYRPPNSEQYMGVPSLIPRTDFPAAICVRVRDWWGDESAIISVLAPFMGTSNVTDGTNNLDGKLFVSMGFRNTIGPYKPADIEGGADDCPLRDTWEVTDELRMLVTGLPSENRIGSGIGIAGGWSWMGEQPLSGYNSDYVLYKFSKTDTLNASANGVREVIWRLTDEGYGITNGDNDNAGRNRKYGLLDFTVTFTETWVGTSNITWKKKLVANIAGGVIEAEQAGSGKISNWESWYCSSSSITKNMAADGQAWNLGSALFNMVSYKLSSHPDAKPSATCITHENVLNGDWDDWRDLCKANGGCDNCGQPNMMTPRGSAGYYDNTGTQLIQVRESGAAANDPGVYMKWSGDDELQISMNDLVFKKGLLEILTFSTGGTHVLGFGGSRSVRGIDTDDNVFFYCPTPAANCTKRPFTLASAGGWLTAFPVAWQRVVEAFAGDPNPTITTGSSIFMVQVALRRRFPIYPVEPPKVIQADRRVGVSFVALSKDKPPGTAAATPNVMWQSSPAALWFKSKGTLNEDAYVGGAFPTVARADMDFNFDCCNDGLHTISGFNFTVSQL